MMPYDSQHHQPPAPVARLALATFNDAMSVANVLATLDSGADVTLLPRWAIEQLGLTTTEERFSLQWFDGSIRKVEVVQLTVQFLHGRFQGRYAVIDEPLGVVGRDLLNHFRILLDGPAQAWQEL